MTAEDTKTCFIAMPITTHEHEAERYGGDADHWNHVMETIFVPAIERAGFVAVRPAAVGSHMIHGQIIRHLSKTDMVLCDLSGHNPNVFFELGVRTSLNLPIALVRDEHTGIPFDTSGLNTHAYASTLNAWDTAREVERLAQHLKDSAESCDGGNPMWRHFGLTIAAEVPTDSASSSDAKVELMFEGMQDLRREVGALRDTMSVRVAEEEFGMPSIGLLNGVSKLAHDLESVVEGSVSSTSPLSKDRFVAHFTRPATAPSGTSIVPAANKIAKEHGYSIVKVSQRPGALDVEVRPH